MINDSERYGRWLRQQRESYDLLLPDVAQIIGVPTERMQGWENGKGKSDGDNNHLDRLLKFYAVLLDILGGSKA